MVLYTTSPKKQPPSFAKATARQAEDAANSFTDSSSGRSGRGFSCYACQCGLSYPVSGIPVLKIFPAYMRTGFRESVRNVRDIQVSIKKEGARILVVWLLFQELKSLKVAVA